MSATHTFAGIEMYREIHRPLCSCGWKGIGRFSRQAAIDGQAAHANGYADWRKAHDIAPRPIVAPLRPVDPRTAIQGCSGCGDIRTQTFTCKGCHKTYCAACDSYLESSPELPCAVCSRMATVMR